MDTTTKLFGSSRRNRRYTLQEKLKNEVIALAGIFQATALVEKLATTGYLPKEEFKTCIDCLLEQNPTSTLDTFGSLDSLELGLQVLIDTLGGLRKQNSQQALRYVLGIFHLQSKLSGRKDLLDIIHSRLNQTNMQAQHFCSTHDNVIGNLADIYVDTISKFRYRIHVRGEATYLQQQRVASQIRALLFSAIRSAILWRQVGGRRWHILLYRQRLLTTAKDLLGQIKSGKSFSD